MKLILDNRTENLNKDMVFDESDEKRSINVLHTLNGNTHTMLSLEREDEVRLDIGGGPDFFIVTCTKKNGQGLTLLNPIKESGNTIELCAGGQYADFPVEIVVDESVASDAIISFYKKNEQSLDWEKE
ncbi:hypothetical protein [Leucothrix arctica]|uniref:Uncharacterized protein n=1 Tax=Leucothrix arctica TaxID=1481894 RepID=A0A317CQA6_9GAMM|nr:hypothetical protein [Leucothrix arctica]PWQ99703.1 hypothetical protein DKT75_00205 [Leucothrix arctica]